MNRFKLDENLYTSFEEIDCQHANMFRIINMLNSMLDESGEENLSIVLEELKHYAGYHFSSEEALFKNYGYSATDEHIAEHRSFVKKIESFDLELLVGTPNLGHNMLSFLEDWLKTHILTHDQKAFDEIAENNKD